MVYPLNAGRATALVVTPPGAGGVTSLVIAAVSAEGTKAEAPVVRYFLEASAFTMI